MNKLTTERLEQIDTFPSYSLSPEQMREEHLAMARELLRLRTDAGDEEVESNYRMAGDWLGKPLVYPEDMEPLGWAELALKKLRDIAIARGNELREAREEVEQLRVQLAGCLTAAEGHFPDPPLCEGDYAWTVAYQKTLNLRRNWDTFVGTRAKPQYEEGDGGYYDLLPGGLDQ